MNQAHITDDQARSVDETAGLIPAHKAPQGRPEQGWQIRPAEASTELGFDDQSNSADAEVLELLLIWLLVAVTCCLSAWAIATSWGIV